MKYITAIQINYLRSLYNIQLDDVDHLNVISGLNDIGKSNVLKALNLFFNGQVDWQSPFDFVNDLSYVRRDDPSEKSKKFISIVLTFQRPDGYSKLPPTFKVKRQWNRYDVAYQQVIYDDFSTWCKANNIDEKTANRNLNRFLRSIDFKYVPAVRDRQYFQYLMAQAQESFVEEHDDPDLKRAGDNLNAQIHIQTSRLRADFENLTGVSAEIEIPTSPLLLLQSASLVRAGKVLLNKRGDGIQAAFLPSLLHFVSSRTKRQSNQEEGTKTRFIWGFEEPENSLEYSKARQLANFFLTYCETNQIFLTTHSPAFIGIESDRVSIYRLYRDPKTTDLVKAANVYKAGERAKETDLAIELGILDLAHELDKTYTKVTEAQAELRRKADIADSLLRPSVFVEGKTDVTILKIAWKKLYDNEMPFDIYSSDPNGSEDSGKGGGGAEAVLHQLEAVRYDAPNLVIGLFDHDDTGLRCLRKLSSNFQDTFVHPSGSLIRKAKKSTQRKVAGISLSIPNNPDRQIYAKKENLPLELFFSDIVLAMRNSKGRGLELGYPDIVLKGTNNRELGKRSSNEAEKLGLVSLEDRIITNGKAIFAAEIVAILDGSEFESFRPLFEVILEIINESDTRLGV
jgi:hypothetical protein